VERTHGRPRPRPRLLVALALAAAVAGGATGALLVRSQPAPLAGRAGRAGNAAAPAAGATPMTTSPAAVPVPRLRLALDRAGRAPWDAPLHLTAEQAVLRSVRVVDDRGDEVTGTLGAQGWSSDATLVPAARYTLTASYTDLGGAPGSAALVARASDPRATLTAVLSPGDADVVGVGQPVVVTASRDVPAAQRAMVLDRLRVRTAPAQQGAWRWVSAREVHWRPRDYWRPHTAVGVDSDLDRLDLGGGTWGSGHHTTDFTIGDRHVSTADTVAHTLTVRAGTTVVRVLPISAGNAQFPTRSGVHLALEKVPSLVFDSSTIGIPSGGSGGYKKTVAWDVRLTYSGTFVHAAPWSQASQGRANVSHGCLNVSTADARWFYDFTRRGDVVTIKGSGVPPLPQDPGSVDWNLSWEQWQAA